MKTGDWERVKRMNTAIELSEKLVRTAELCERLARDVQATIDAMQERAGARLEALRKAIDDAGAQP